MKREYFLDPINKTINFSFDYDQNLINEVRFINHAAWWNPEKKLWIVPVNKYTKNRILNVVRKNGFVQIPFEQGEEVSFSYEITNPEFEQLSEICQAQGFSYTPRKYQIESLAYAREKGSFINGDDMGLGKTFESIIYAETENAFPCLVITPATVKYNWAEKWAEIVGKKRSISVIESKPKKSCPNNWNADVVIINYDIIGKKQGKGVTINFPELLETQWRMGIFDEAHFLKEKDAQRSAAARRITKKHKDMTVQLLTGTAINQRPVEIWNLLKIIGKDHLIANDWHQFIRKYCGGHRGKYGWVTSGATNMLELNRKLRKHCYLRREKRDVLGELPQAIKSVLKVAITNKRKINHANEDFLGYLAEHYDEDKVDAAMEAEHLVAISELRKLAVLGKLKSIEQYLKDWKASTDKKLIVFGIHREPLDHLSEKFGGDIIAGGVSSKKKQEIVKRFQTDDNQFLFANQESAGTGTDGLQNACSNMIIIELPWRPSDIDQVVARLERSGQKEPPVVDFLLNFDTIDKEMWEMLVEKEYVMNAVNKGVDVRIQESGLECVIKKILKNNGN